MRKVLRKAIDTYGVDMQLNVAIEELSELIKEICKHKRGAKNTEVIIEEMADCYIMLEQMEMIFGLGSGVITEAINKKVERLNKRLNLEKKESPKMKTTDLLIFELLALSVIHNARGEVDTAKLLRESAYRLRDTDKIAEHYRKKAEANT